MTSQKKMEREERARAQKERDDLLMGALVGRCEPLVLDRLAESGARVDGAALGRAAAHGDAEAVRWALSRWNRAPGEGRVSLWSAAGSGGHDPQKARALIEALGLPRELEGPERRRAQRALADAALGGGFELEGLRILLDAIEPLGEADAGPERDHYLTVAAGHLAGPRKALLILRHPKHGPAMGPELKAKALAAALRSGGGPARGELLAFVQELFGQASLTAPDHKGASVSLLALAAEKGRVEELSWMLGSGDERVTLAAAKEALRRCEGGLGAKTGRALKEWIRVQEERAELEGVAEPAATRGAGGPRV